MKLRTTAEVADALGCTPQTIRKFVKDGLLPSVRFGPHGRLRFDERAVAEAVRAKTGQHATAAR
jgi:excisionase family DNA binding protein